MSREVDTSDLESLSEEDLKYLHDRSQITTAQYAEALGMPEGELKAALQEAINTGLALEDRANTGTANTAGASKEEYEAGLKARNGLDEEGEEEEEDEEEESYEDLTNDQLRAELASRQLSTSGNKQEMIARLEENDASEEDEEEEEQE